MNYQLGLYVLLVSIILSSFINYYYMVQNFSTQLTNFLIISLIIGGIISFTAKQNISFQKILKYTCIIFLILFILYLIYLAYKGFQGYRFGSLHSIMIIFTIFVICIFSYIIGSSIKSKI